MSTSTVPASSPPGVFESIVAVMPPGTVGWVFQGYEDEDLDATLHAGRAVLWDDARSRGKVPGQPALFLQAIPGKVRWMGWGRVAIAGERWLVLGVPVRCFEVVRGGLPIVDPEVAARGEEPVATHEWEYRELGHALGLGAYRERTPYLDVGARDLRLSAHDLAFLLRLQPALARFGRST